MIRVKRESMIDMVTCDKCIYAAIIMKISRDAFEERYQVSMVRKDESFHGCWRFDEIKIIILKRTDSISMWSKVHSITLIISITRIFRLNTSRGSFVCSNSDHSIGKNN